ncbi:uncharacterized protein LAJ45_05299 [Morchella importuna]|nr:uncharacterized protein LAJ45_11766 [Morchella importuna]XP_045970107.1 uncharacterized protein LAJ45_07146 [Morchella importuna]XP_045971907.1 uncharacterized protein LAJ45_05299 [Morchella importuna]KAH8144263.1 hypothetical protein LAJ45_11766 [Morchella importuna]KAH8148803.1 hypothetical protein LAJ45_07146 [Morchella importuna]KAH8150603.1 hypothetical protein LAJ45_05299 [Morchella importuna]
MLEKQQTELLASMTQFMRPPAPSHPSAASRAREPKAHPQAKFNGKANNVETFIRQCENVFSIESQFFTYEEVRIRYAGNLMEGEAPANWYEAYHSSIDQASANRIAGMSVVLDEKWKCWDSFVDALRAAFGEAISRDDAAAQWKALTLTAKGQLVDDKILSSHISEPRHELGSLYLRYTSGFPPAWVRQGVVPGIP